MSNIRKTKKGVPFDLTAITMQNASTLAAGNMPVNAKGDVIGPGGKVLTKAEEIARKQASIPSTPARTTSLKPKDSEAAAEEATEKKPAKKTKKEVRLPNGDIEIKDEE